MADDNNPPSPVDQHVTNILADLRTNPGNTEHGKAVFKAAEDTLPPHLKQSVYQKVGMAGVEAECQAANNQVGTLMRGATSYQGFNTQFMATYAQDYSNAVAYQTIEALKAAQNGPDMPTQDLAGNPLTSSNIRGPQLPNDMDVGSQKWNDFYADANADLTAAVQTQMPKLSPEARDFLAACSEGARKGFAGADPVVQQQAVNKAMGNTLILRCALPAVINEANHLVANGPAEQDRILGKMLNSTASLTQTLVNGAADGRLNAATAAGHVCKSMTDKDPTITQGLTASLEMASNGTIPIAAPAQLAPDNAGDLLPRQTVPVVAPAPAQEADSPAAKTSVRDMLKSAASSLKNTIKEKLGLDDQSKLERMEKQLAKRENHVADLEKRKAAVDLTLKDPDIAAALNKKYDLDKHMKGTGPERAEQMEIKEAQDLKKASDKLGGRIDKNEDKAQELKDKIGAHKTKMVMKAALKETPQDVGAAGGVKV
ncbi:hypothetical protein WJU23_18885 [Prosthecobacter sp. SYSU 5D2]|uniref:hypothetical protein n=1 Tax=Prosthecobacter sp. SYSU 5D2 TaxID=3134134 RepID=UPI0031FE96AC